VDVCLDQSEGVHMRQRYISTVMETIEPLVSAGLTDAKVIDLWAQRQRSPLTRSVYLRDIRRLLRTTGLKLRETSALDLERLFPPDRLMEPVAPTACRESWNGKWQRHTFQVTRRVSPIRFAREQQRHRCH